VFNYFAAKRIIDLRNQNFNKLLESKTVELPEHEIIPDNRPAKVGSTLKKRDSQISYNLSRIDSLNRENDMKMLGDPTPENFLKEDSFDDGFNQNAADNSMEYRQFIAQQKRLEPTLL